MIWTPGKIRIATLRAPCPFGRQGLGHGRHRQKDAVQNQVRFIATAPHALRSATIGSTAVARRAGMKHATAAAPNKSSATATKVAGSVGAIS